MKINSTERNRISKEILSVLPTDRFITLLQIKKLLGNKYSVGLISSIIWSSKSYGIGKMVDYKEEWYGEEIWQTRQEYKLKIK